MPWSGWVVLIALLASLTTWGAFLILVLCMPVFGAFSYVPLESLAVTVSIAHAIGVKAGGPFMHSTCAANTGKSILFARSYVAARSFGSCGDFRLSIERLGGDLRQGHHQLLHALVCRSWVNSDIAGLA